MQTRAEIDQSSVEHMETVPAVTTLRCVGEPMAALSRSMRSFILDIEEMKRAMIQLRGRDLETAIQAIDERVRQAQDALQQVGEMAARPYRKAVDARALSVRTQTRIVLAPKPMRVLRLRIENFQRVEQVVIEFNSKLVPATMQGIEQSTLYDALDLVLGPDRFGQYPPVEEMDFHNVEFLGVHGRPPQPLLIEVMLVNLSDEVERACAAHTECWNVQERCLSDVSSADTSSGLIRCLRLRTVAAYDPADAQFNADTHFPYGVRAEDGASVRVDASVKRMLAPLYRSMMRASLDVLRLERSSLEV